MNEREPGLVVRYLNDNEPPISDIEQLKKQLNAHKSNGGDGRCLCSGCLMFWALQAIESKATA